MKRLLLAFALTATLATAQTNFPGIESIMTLEEFRNAGLDKLSAAEIAVLNGAITKHFEGAIKTEVAKQSDEIRKTAAQEERRSILARFGLPEIDIGLMGGVRHTMRVFPIGLTRRMVLTGYRVPAEELYRRGLIEACVEPDELLPTAMEMAKNIASKSPTAIRLAKRALNTVETMGLKDGYRFEQNLTVDMTGTADSKEAMAAFLEKRPAVFQDE